jgi:peptidyl-prolyl cis-trans isomerase D
MIKTLEKFRNTILGSFFAILLSVSMLGFGVNLFIDSSSDEVIQVNGEKIPTSEFYRRKSQEEQRLREMLGAQYQALAGNFMKGLDQRIADSLVQSKLISQLAERIGLSGPSDGLLKQKIKESFTQGWSAAAYDRLLASLGLTAAQFQNEFRKELRDVQLKDIVTDASVPTANEINQTILDDYRSHTIDYLVMDSSYFTKGEFRNVPEKELLSFYSENQNQFTSPAAVEYNYLIVSTNLYPELVKVESEDINRYYRQNLEKFQTSQAIQLQHVQLTTPKDLSEADLKDFNSDVTHLFKKIRDGFSFDRAVDLYSDDYSTRWNNGKTTMLEPGKLISEFEKEVWKHVDENNQEPFLISTEYGYHIARVASYKAPKPIPIESVEADIISRITRELAPSFLAEKAQSLLDQWNTSNQPLEAFARANSIPLERSGKALQASQDPSATVKGLTSKILSFDGQDKLMIKLPSAVVLAEVVKNQKETPLPFTDVKDKVIDSYTSSKANDLAKVEMEKDLEQLKNGTFKTLADIPINESVTLKSDVIVGIKKDNPTELNFPEFLDSLKALGGKTGFSGKVVPTLDGRFLLFHVKNVKDPEKDLLERKFSDYKGKATEVQAELILQSILNSLRFSSKIEVPSNLSGYGE